MLENAPRTPPRSATSISKPYSTFTCRQQTVSTAALKSFKTFQNVPRNTLYIYSLSADVLQPHVAQTKPYLTSTCCQQKVCTAALQRFRNFQNVPWNILYIHLLSAEDFTTTCGTHQIKSTRKATVAFNQGQIVLSTLEAT